MKTTLHRIITKDGLELVGLLYEPDGVSDSKEILVHVHGMGGNFYENPFVDSIAKKLTSEGVALFVFNNRGCEAIKDLTKTIDSKKDSKKSFVRIGSTYEKFEDCIFDIGAAMDFVAGQGFNKINLSGHSLGTSKIVFYITEANDKRINSILLLSPADMHGLARDEGEGFEEFIKEANEKAESGRGSELLSKLLWNDYLLSASTYLSLFGEKSKTGIFNLYKPEDKLEVLSKITQPLFVIMGRKDDAIVVPVEEVMSRIKNAATNSSRVETKILGDANHGYFGDEDALAQEVCDFINGLKNL